MSSAAAQKPLSKRAQNRSKNRMRALDAALHVFSNCGYAAATMDAIAAQAGLTKPTLYQYFQNKDELFKEMMFAPRKHMLMAFEHSMDECHVRQLINFSWNYANTVMHPNYLALARLVIADAHRNPELGNSYQSNGPDKVLKGLADFMTSQSSLGRLDITDAELAAEDFWGLILSAPRNKALHDPHANITKKHLRKYIHNGIRVFLKAYSTNPQEDLRLLESLLKTDKITGKR